MNTRSKFHELLRFQYITEYLSFERHVLDCIDKFKEDERDNKMSLSQIREALLYADQHKSRSDVNKLLSRGSGLPVDEMLMEESKQTLFRIDSFTKALKSGLLKRSHPEKKMLS